MKKFKFSESNKCIDIAIRIEKLMKILNNKLDHSEIDINSFLEQQEKINLFLNKSIDLISKWEKECKNNGTS